MNNIPRRLFIGSACTFISTLSYAQKVEVLKSGSKKINFSIRDFGVPNNSVDELFVEVLKNDLVRSGWFRFDNKRPQFLLTGSLIRKQELRVEIHALQNSTKKSVFSRAFESASDAHRALAHRVADAIIEAILGHPGMSSAKVAVVGNRTGYKELYICDIDGFNLKQVTSDKSIVVAPSWLPNKKSVLYTSYKGGYPNIYQTGRSKSLSNHGGLNTSACVSPNGKYMALILSKDGNPELYIKEIKTGLLKRLTRTYRANEASPCWSPDGSQLAYVSDSSGRPHIYIIDIKKAKPRRISNSGSENVAPDWGTNGLITYCSRQRGRYRIMVADPITNYINNLPLDYADYEDPCWAPDQRHIIASRTINYQSSIYLLDTIEDRPILLINKKGDWFSPSCTP